MRSSYLKSVRREKERELRDYQTRLKQLENIKQDLYQDFNDNESGIVKEYLKTESGVEYGYRCSGGVMIGRPQWNDLRGGSLGELDQAAAYVRKEMNDVVRKIEQLQQEIGNLNRKIEIALQEEKREREETLRRLLGG